MDKLHLILVFCIIYVKYIFVEYFFFQPLCLFLYNLGIAAKMASRSQLLQKRSNILTSIWRHQDRGRLA